MVGNEYLSAEAITLARESEMVSCKGEFGLKHAVDRFFHDMNIRIFRTADEPPSWMVLKI